MKFETKLNIIFGITAIVMVWASWYVSSFM